MSAMKLAEYPNIAEILAPILARVPRQRQPLLLASAERLAAERYRGWAEHPSLAAHRKNLLACAEREIEIATRVEAMFAGASAIQEKLLATHAEMVELNRDLFAERPLAAQFAIQASGERLGAATWRAFAAQAGEPVLAATFETCATLDEISAEVLEEIVAVAAGTALEARHLNAAELEAGLEEIRQSPRDAGPLRLIVRRPDRNRREVIAAGQLDPVEGLVGDNWKARGWRGSADRSAHPDMQLNIMNARVAALVAQDRDRWALAGDQLYLDLDLSGSNLPAGTRLAIGGAVIEVTAEPHTGCAKFIARFGLDAMKFVNSPVGRELNLRGINAKVIRAGTIRVGDFATKGLSPSC